eukprot:m.100024 g.100024  ORF g.100024 m.100024 type:complete len:273 (+) comp51456_c0_seq1:167-985(+)
MDHHVLPNATAELADLEVLKASPFPITVLLPGGQTLEVSTHPNETISDLKTKILQSLKIDSQAHRYSLVYSDHEVNEGTVHEHALYPRSRVHFVPRTRTGLNTTAARVESSMTKLSELQKLFDTAATSESLANGQPLTLQTTLNGQPLQIQLIPQAPARPQATAPLSREDLERETNRMLHTKLDELKAQKKEEKLRDDDNQKMRSKIEALRETMKNRKLNGKKIVKTPAKPGAAVSSATTTLKPAETKPAQATPPTPAPTGYCGFRRGFLLK